MKFRKKPVVIEAMQLSERSIDEIACWAKITRYECDDGLAQLRIPTLEGMMIASNGDWIIKGVNGEFYPCKPDIFEKTYEPVIGSEK